MATIVSELLTYYMPGHLTWSIPHLAKFILTVIVIPQTLKES